MMDIFVTGMIRSGTSLIQVLLTNHPQLFVAYQPFHQLYVDAKNIFFDIHGYNKKMPLGDGSDSDSNERELFKQWLRTYKFSAKQTDTLIANCNKGKGGSAADQAFDLTIRSGTFYEIRRELHCVLSRMYRKPDAKTVGSKEVLCEEFIPCFIEQMINCLVIIRDPRAVVASASYGSYQTDVGDKYPILMLLRMWRKSAAYWLSYRNASHVRTIRYEDLVGRTAETLDTITHWLNVPRFRPRDIEAQLLDHKGNPWVGNSSFGVKLGIDESNTEAWRHLLSEPEIKFIEACTWPEMRLLGYSPIDQPKRKDIADFIPDEHNVRQQYNQYYACDQRNLAYELFRWEKAQNGDYSVVDVERLLIDPALFSA